MIAKLSAAQRRSLVDRWLVALAAMTSGQVKVPDLELKVKAIGTQLRDNFQDDRCFSDETLAYVAERVKFFPAYGELHGLLTQWWQANQKPQEGSPAWMPPDIDEAEMDLVNKMEARFFRKRRDEGATRGQLGTILNRVRQTREAAYEWLVRNDGEAAHIARARGWPMVATFEAEAAEARAWLQDRAAVEQAIGKILDSHTATYVPNVPWRMLRLMLKKHAPENLDMMSEQVPEYYPPPDPPAWGARDD
jgi:hypothetical protein